MPIHTHTPIHVYTHAYTYTYVRTHAHTPGTHTQGLSTSLNLRLGFYAAEHLPQSMKTLKEELTFP